MRSFVRRLASRKLLAALGVVAVGLGAPVELTEKIVAAAGLVAFIIAEGAADALGNGGASGPKSSDS